MSGGSSIQSNTGKELKTDSVIFNLSFANFQGDTLPIFLIKDKGFTIEHLFEVFSFGFVLLKVFTFFNIKQTSYRGVVASTTTISHKKTAE